MEPIEKKFVSVKDVFAPTDDGKDSQVRKSYSSIRQIILRTNRVSACEKAFKKYSYFPWEIDIDSNYLWEYLINNFPFKIHRKLFSLANAQEVGNKWK